MSLEIGQKIQEDKYSIVRLLGEGGMGAVYEGLNNKIQRKVAIKVLHASVSENADAVARFEREATAAGRIGSDHITEVLDMGELPGGARYMVMEYMDGVSLSKRIEDRGRLSAQEAAQIVVQVLDGLMAAHEASIIHRDLKPDNVFLLKSKAGRKDYVKILDFGISKFNALSGDNLSMTKTNAVLGTPYYMSPEQAKGSKAVDQRCDVYSVGVILYESVTGQVPFDADTFNELIFKIVLEAPPPPEQFVPDLDPNISAIIRRAMARDVTQRFQSAVEFRDALMSWMESGHVPMFQESATNVARNAMQSLPSDMSQYRGTHSAGTPATPAPWTGDASGAAPQPPKSNGAIIGVAVLGALALVAAIGIFVVKPALSKDSSTETAATQAPSASSAPATPASAASATTPAATSAPVASAVVPDATTDATAAKPTTPSGGSKGNTPAAGAGNKPTTPAGKPGGRGVRTTLDLSGRVRHESARENRCRSDEQPR
jgi:serine/threonine-protein kinase